MADVMQTSDLIVIAQNYRGDLVRQINRASVALRLFPFVPGEGGSISLVAQGSGALAETFSEGEVVSNFGSDSQKSAIIPWARYRANIHTSFSALGRARNSRTPLGNVQLWARNIGDSMNELASKMNQGFYTGAGGNAFVGLAEAIGDDANTYAGIDRSDAANAYWRPYVVDPGVPTAITYDQIRKDLETIYINSGTRPDVALVHPATRRAISSLFDPLKQYVMRTDVIPTMGQRGVVTFEGGVGAVEFDGCWFIEDKDCPSGRIHYISTPRVRFEYLDMTEVLNDILGDETAPVAIDDGFGDTPIPLAANIVGLAIVADAYRATCRTELQLGVERPNACGTRYHVAVT